MQNHPVIPFVKGQPFTIIKISEHLAHTTKEEIIVTSLLPTPEFRKAHRPSWRYGTFKLKGKRKEFYLDIKAGSIVFAGHGIVRIDSEVRLSSTGDSGFSGNACYNLCGTPEELRNLITTRNLNPEFTALDSVIAIPPGDDARTWYDKRRETLAFPEVDTHHAVVQGMRERAATPPNVTDFTPPATVPVPALASALDFL